MVGKSTGRKVTLAVISDCLLCSNSGQSESLKIWFEEEFSYIKLYKFDKFAVSSDKRKFKINQGEIKWMHLEL